MALGGKQLVALILQSGISGPLQKKITKYQTDLEEKKKDVENIVLDSCKDTLFLSEAEH